MIPMMEDQDGRRGRTGSSGSRARAARRNYDSSTIYFSEHAAVTAGDAFTVDVIAAHRRLLHTEDIRWPDTGEPVGPALYGNHCRAPSIVWSALAASSLVAAGLAPSAESMQLHTTILRRRLSDAVATSPETATPDDWVLRTRHVALALQGLAEFDLGAVNPADLQPLEQEAFAAHKTAAQAALIHLMGDGADWIGISDDQPFWPEHWGSRRPNLLNSLYAALAIVKAHRHGYRVSRALADAWSTIATVEGTIKQLVALIEISPQPDGPRTRLRGDWIEPWARLEPLPCSVVALLALLLCEYEQLLSNTASSPRVLERAHDARVLAQRLGHELVSRAHEWATTIDAFSYGPTTTDPWFVPAYSVCLRAILATNVAGTNSRAVRVAHQTIEASGRNGRDGHTWVDPTRLGDFGSDAVADPSWHSTVVISDLLTRTDLKPTASSIHAAVTALAALRRAAATPDPRELYSQKSQMPRSPFTHLELTVLDGARWQLAAHVGETHDERLVIRQGLARIIQALSELGTASAEEIADYVGQTTREASTKLTRNPESVRKAVDRLNRQFGVELIERARGQSTRPFLVRATVTTNE